MRKMIKILKMKMLERMLNKKDTKMDLMTLKTISKALLKK